MNNGIICWILHAATIRMLHSFLSFTSLPPVHVSRTWKLFAVQKKKDDWMEVKPFMNTGALVEDICCLKPRLNRKMLHETDIDFTMLHLPKSHSRCYKQRRGWEAWLTAWAAWFSASCTGVGQGLGLLGLEGRSAGPLWPPCEFTPLPVSSPALPELLPPPFDGMFSLLMLAPVDKRKESRYYDSSLFFLSARCRVKNKHQGHLGGLLTPPQADNVLFSIVLILFTVYLLLMTLSASLALRHSSNPHVSDLPQDFPKTRISLTPVILTGSCLSWDATTHNKTLYFVSAGKKPPQTSLSLAAETLLKI